RTGGVRVHAWALAGRVRRREPFLPPGSLRAGRPARLRQRRQRRALRALPEESELSAVIRFAAVLAVALVVVPAASARAPLDRLEVPQQLKVLSYYPTNAGWTE